VVSHDTLQTGGWAGPRAGLDAVKKRKICCPYRESNNGSYGSKLFITKYMKACHLTLSCPNQQLSPFHTSTQKLKGNVYGIIVQEFIYFFIVVQLFLKHSVLSYCKLNSFSLSQD
jgi:hypothetical protein